MYDIQQYPVSQGTATQAILPYLRRVYSLFLGGVVFAVVGALVALYSGAPVPLDMGGGQLAVPPMVAFGLQHGIIAIIVYIAAFFGANMVRRKPGINLVALFGYTFITGVFIAPALFIAQLAASHGATLSPAPVRDAFLLTAGAFTGLTGYVLITKRDFSFMGAGLSMGLWVIIGASLLNFFFHSSVFQLAISSVGVLLFCGYILFDTSRILKERDESDPIGAALRLFLDVINLFMFLLQILSSGRRR